MKAATSGYFDVVVAESLDRLSRDQEDTAAFFKRLSFINVQIVTLAEGEITHLQVGFKGTMNAMYLKDLADKTRRGLRGRVEAGKSGGGNAFGYVVRPGGERAVDHEQAAVVVRILTEYAAGGSPQTIAKRLNGEGLHGPLVVRGARVRFTATPSAAQAFSTTNSISDALCGTDCVTSKTPIQGGACRGSIRRRPGW